MEKDKIIQDVKIELGETEISDEKIELKVDDAILEVEMVGFPTKLENKAARYLALHFLTYKDQLIKREKVDVLEREYNVNEKLGLYGSSYGQEYARMLNELTESKRKKPALKVVKSWQL